MRTLRQIFEEQGENLLLIDTCNGIVFQMMKDNEDFFRLIEYNNFDDCIMPKEYILEISDFEDIEKSKAGGYYSGCLEDICEIKNFTLYKEIQL